MSMHIGFHCSTEQKRRLENIAQATGKSIKEVVLDCVRESQAAGVSFELSVDEAQSPDLPHRGAEASEYIRRALLTGLDAVAARTLESESNDNAPGATRRAIIDLLKTADEPMSPAEIARALGINPPAARKTLSRMLRSGDIRRSGRGKYTSAT